MSCHPGRSGWGGQLLPLPGARWTDSLLPAFCDRLATPAALIAIGAGLAAILIARSVWGRAATDSRKRGAAASMLVAAAVLALAYMVTPYTAGGPEGLPVLVAPNARYLTPALLLATPLAERASDSAPARRHWACRASSQSSGRPGRHERPAGPARGLSTRLGGRTGRCRLVRSWSVGVAVVRPV
jgi:hypothetical protein